MRVNSNGSVSVSESDISMFCSQWPASGLRGLRGVVFEFERNGDLVDVRYKNGNSDRWDGPALAALSQDAQEYAAASQSSNTKRVARDRFARAGHFPWWWPKSWGTGAARR